MNDQHQVLLKMMNKLYDGTADGMQRIEALDRLGKLFNYTVKHFKEEEEYMESIGFEGLKSHKLIHVNLLERLGVLAEGFKNSTDEKLSADFFNFLKFWLSAHIKGIDMKYGEHASEQKAG
jgi:hemerythrin